MRDGHREFRGRRTALALLRVAHLAGMVGVGAAVLAGAPTGGFAVFAALLVGSGLGIMALDLWANPDYLRQLAGIAVVAKLLLLVLWLVAAHGAQWPFWLVLAGSTLIAHAPARLRHRLLRG